MLETLVQQFYDKLLLGEELTRIREGHNMVVLPEEKISTRLKS